MPEVEGPATAADFRGAATEGRYLAATAAGATTAADEVEGPASSEGEGGGVIWHRCVCFHGGGLLQQPPETVDLCDRFVGHVETVSRICAVAHITADLSSVFL